MLRDIDGGVEKTNFHVQGSAVYKEISVMKKRDGSMQALLTVTWELKSNDVIYTLPEELTEFGPWLSVECIEGKVLVFYQKKQKESMERINRKIPVTMYRIVEESKLEKIDTPILEGECELVINTLGSKGFLVNIIVDKSYKESIRDTWIYTYAGDGSFIMNKKLPSRFNDNDGIRQVKMIGDQGFYIKALGETREPVKRQAACTDASDENVDERESKTKDVDVWALQEWGQSGNPKLAFTVVMYRFSNDNHVFEEVSLPWQVRPLFVDIWGKVEVDPAQNQFEVIARCKRGKKEAQQEKARFFLDTFNLQEISYPDKDS